MFPNKWIDRGSPALSLRNHQLVANFHSDLQFCISKYFDNLLFEKMF